MYVCGQYIDGSNYGYRLFSNNFGGPPWYWSYYHRASSGLVVAMDCPTAIVADTWAHIAIVKTGSVWDMYLNGVKGATRTDANAPADINLDWVWGALNVAGDKNYFPFPGNLDDWCFHDEAVYSGDFTPAQLSKYL